MTDDRNSDNDTSDDSATDQQSLRDRLTQLRIEHRDMDDVIERVEDAPIIDRLQVQRLKKRKLRLKDEISRLEALVVPDIIA